MKFGFDIDDTLIDLRRYGFELYNEKLGMNVPLSTFETIPTVEIHTAFGMTEEEGSAMWQRSMEDIYFKSCPIFEGALETIQDLYEEGHEIYYITSRPKEYCSRSRDWMIAQGFPVVDGHFFCGMQDNEKIETIKSLELDFYFDDKPAVLETLADVNTEVVVVNQSYNQNVECLRLNKWADFKQLVLNKGFIL